MSGTDGVCMVWPALAPFLWPLVPEWPHSKDEAIQILQQLLISLFSHDIGGMFLCVCYTRSRRGAGYSLYSTDMTFDLIIYSTDMAFDLIICGTGIAFDHGQY
eukprot:3941443-Rhodomonas_salina.1